MYGWVCAFVHACICKGRTGEKLEENEARRRRSRRSTGRAMWGMKEIKRNNSAPHQKCLWMCETVGSTADVRALLQGDSTGSTRTEMKGQGHYLNSLRRTELPVANASPVPQGSQARAQGRTQRPIAQRKASQRHQKSHPGQAQQNLTTGGGDA